jgi:hypothetical protein
MIIIGMRYCEDCNRCEEGIADGHACYCGKPMIQVRGFMFKTPQEDDKYEEVTDLLFSEGDINE